MKSKKGIENSSSPIIRWEDLKILSLSFLFVVTSFYFNHNKLINLADEGFLWYGSWRTALGEVPFRDFQSYDPGRYYWNAFWMALLSSHDLFVVRLANAIFQLLGLTCGLLVLRRLSSKLVFLIPMGFVLTVWMYTVNKLYEPSIAMTAVFFAVRLNEKPTSHRHLISGIFTGLAAFFGRNHGLYAFIAFLGVICFLEWRCENNGKSWAAFFRRLFVWMGGIVIGYLPMILMFLLIPGFFDAFLDQTMMFLRLKTTNLYLPIHTPWLVWRILYPQLGFWGTIRHAVLFLSVVNIIWISLMIVLPLYFLLSKRSLTDSNKILLSSIIVAIPYYHHATSRYDLPHLAQTVHPLWLALAALFWILIANKKVIFRIFGSLIPIFFLLSICVVYPASNTAIASAVSTSVELIDYPYVQKKIWVTPSVAAYGDILKRINEFCILPDENIFLAPDIPAFYVLLNRRSPVADIYPLYAQTHERQQELIAEFERKNVNWIVLGDIKIDERDDLRFMNTHKLIWSYIQENYVTLWGEGMPPAYRLFHKKTATYADADPQKLKQCTSLLNRVDFR